MTGPFDGDRIEIVNLALFARHGVFAEEAALGQRFSLDIVAGLDLRAAGRSDQVSDTVNYAALTATVTEAFGQRRKLIEAAAATVAAAVLERHPLVDWVQVTVRKPAAPVAAVFDHMAVTISRARGRDERTVDGRAGDGRAVDGRTEDGRAGDGRAGDGDV